MESCEFCQLQLVKCTASVTSFVGPGVAPEIRREDEIDLEIDGP